MVSDSPAARRACPQPAAKLGRIIAGEYEKHQKRRDSPGESISETLVQTVKECSRAPKSGSERERGGNSGNGVSKENAGTGVAYKYS